jgi:hypothetical protein
MAYDKCTLHHTNHYCHYHHLFAINLSLTIMTLNIILQDPFNLSIDVVILIVTGAQIPIKSLFYQNKNSG